MQYRRPIIISNFLIRSLLLVGISFSASTSFANPPPFIIQSHRGAGVLAPENSLEAFELGWKLGTIPEADVRTTSDGIIVAFHDKTFDRVVHDATPELKKLGVRDITFAELSKLDVGAETKDSTQRGKIRTMAEFFVLMSNKPDRQLYLDLKEVDLSALSALVKQHHVTSQVILASTKLEQIREWNRLVPDGKTLLWMGGKEDSLRSRIEQLKTENFAGITQLQIHIRESKDASGASIIQPSEDFIRQLAAELKPRNILFQALPWSADQPEVYQRLLGLGIQSFATDHPDVVVPVMRQHFATAPVSTDPH